MTEPKARQGHDVSAELPACFCRVLHKQHSFSPFLILNIKFKLGFSLSDLRI